ncbi:AAA family ATPase [Methylomonas koyamae]|uniref:AAA family ATPase n=1 Tax=Methylomonas koyamae TaxID=702114 RepID=UPI00287346B4|nr:AAA family ATPase [Methylomonas koyamae]WNB76010.1 AAA family ATPase [Methylomonas koyamae]
MDDLLNLESALAVLAEAGHANDYERWRDYGLALKNEAYRGNLRESEAFELWETFSRADASKYDAQVCRTYWDNFKPKADGLGLGTIFYQAKCFGWTSTKAEPGDFGWIKNLPDPNELAGPDGLSLPYFDFKGVSPPPDYRIYKNATLVSYKTLDGRVTAVESFVDASPGTTNKKLLAGSVRSAAFVAYDDLTPEIDTVYLAEGVGTAGAIAESLDANFGRAAIRNGDGLAQFQARRGKYAVLAVGSKSNLQHVASAVRQKHPAATIVLVADRDAEKSCFAYALGISGVKVATMPADASPEVGNFDAWDLWNSKGFEAVIGALEGAVYTVPEAPGSSKLPKPCPVAEYLEKPPKPREWLIDGLLPLNGIALLIAAGGTGKSWLLLDLCFALATGTPWAGGLGRPTMRAAKYGFDPSATLRGVLYLAAEDSSDEIQLRLHNLYQATLRRLEFCRSEFGCVVDEWKRQITDNAVLNLHILPNAGKSSLLLRAGEHTPLVGELIAKAAEIENLGLIVVEPLARLHDSNENDSVEMTRVVELLEHLSTTTGATVVVAHHTNKAANLNGGRNAAASRGSSAVVDGCRLVFQMSGMTLDEGKQLGVDSKQHVSFQVVKANHLPPLDPFWLRRESGGRLQFTQFDTSPEAAEAKIIEAICIKVAELCAADDLLTKRKFSETFSSELGVGRVKLETLTGKAIAQGRVQQKSASALADRFRSAKSQAKKSILLLVAA